MPDVLPSIIGDTGPQEAKPVVLVDSLGNIYKAVVDGASPVLGAGSNIIGKVGIDQTTPGTTNGVQLNAPIPAGTALMGKVGIDQTTPGTTNGVTPLASENHVGEVGGLIAAISGTLALRANATAYTSGKIIAQSATAGSCSGIALAVARVNDKSGMLRRMRLKINSVTWLNAIIRVHLFKDTPTFTNADAGTFAAGLTESQHLGYLDITLDQSFSDPFVKGIGAPAVGSEINFTPSAGTQNIFAVLEARSTVTADAASKTFSFVAEVHQN